MKRREFITLLGGVAAAWPLAVRAQQAQMPVIGFLHTASPDPFAHLVHAFREGLLETGFNEGTNVQVQYRWTEGHQDRLAAMAADLVSRKVNIIACPGSTAAAIAAKAATSTIPIVFGVGDDPVKLGLVASLARPAGNATGINFFTVELATKRLGLLRELLPRAARIALLINPANATNAASTRIDVETAAKVIGLDVDVLKASNTQEIDAAFEEMGRRRLDVLLAGPDPFFNSRRAQLATLAARYAIPAIYAAREYAAAGGLMSYGADLLEMFRQVGAYTGRVLKGAKPADLPVFQSIKFELVINLRTAKALALEVPPTLLARADEVIE